MVRPPKEFFTLVEPADYSSGEEGVVLFEDNQADEDFMDLIGANQSRSVRVKFFKYQKDCQDFGTCYFNFLKYLRGRDLSIPLQIGKHV